MDGLHARINALDVARALAICGMVLINFRAMSAADDALAPWLGWGLDRVEGKAAALFVVLAGAGLSLRAQAWEARGRPRLAFRRSVFRRAIFLFLLGLLNLHVWEWDILHCYGLYLFAGAYLVHASSAELARSGAIVVLVSLALQAARTEVLDFDFFTLAGGMLEMTSAGLYPFFPWATFLVFGIWLGRRLTSNELGGRVWVLGALLVVLGLEAITDHLMPGYDFAVQGLTWTKSLIVWPRPAGMAFVASGICVSYLVIRLCLWAEARYARGRVVGWLARTGRLPLTIYLLHVWLIVILDWHGGLLTERLSRVVVYGICLFVLCGAMANWWIRRYPHGPIEKILRQFAEPADRQPGRRG